MTEKDKPCGVEETTAPWESKPVVDLRPQGAASVADAARETMRRYPRIMARLAE